MKGDQREIESEFQELGQRLRVDYYEQKSDYWEMWIKIQLSYQSSKLQFLIMNDLFHTIIYLNKYYFY